MTYLPTSTPGRCSSYFFCRKESLLLLNSPLSFCGVLLYGTFTIGKLLLSGEFGFGFVYHNWQTSSDCYSRWKKMINGCRIDSLRWKHFCPCRAFHSRVGGSPFPRIAERKISKLLQEEYTRPKPQHVDNKLYVVIGVDVLFFLMAYLVLA